MITIYKVRGKYNDARHRDYLLDFDSEFANLPGLNICAVGSHAYSAESGKAKILNSAGAWVDDKTGTSGGGGGGGEGAMHWIGVTTTALTDGATTNPIMINGESVTAKAGDLTQYLGDEFVFSGTAWQAFSDEQMQSDWDQTDTNAKDYIKNKPTVLSENDVNVLIGTALGEIGVIDCGSSTEVL